MNRDTQSNGTEGLGVNPADFQKGAQKGLDKG